ncbi:hypothetical protein BDQ12DRAFT_687270 [Crucibulum laeve]|uniref:MYND-type domain-containing protein n=1 Tax=Crucibulum laeve TaxID=68775 RepID=A0A5C3LSB1_9AGAR|nr:hypothetical protein BDQ12DRAFT_687270 [Crucibulum laeve]
MKINSATCLQCGKPDAEITCQRCSAVDYCSQGCLEADKATHERDCDVPKDVIGVIINSDRDRRVGKPVFELTTITASHPIHRSRISSPLMNKIEFPLIIHRHTPGSWMDREEDDEGLENSIATNLMMMTENGEATVDWSQQAGTVTVMRQDRKPLSLEAIEIISKFHDHIHYLFHAGRLDEAQEMQDFLEFESFCQDYKRKMKANEPRFANLRLPLQVQIGSSMSGGEALGGFLGLSI